MATTKAKTEEIVDVQESALNELFIDELKDIYWAEKHLMKALPKMAKAATSEGLRDAIEKHVTETEGQIGRLEQVFKSIGEKAVAVKCEAMAGLIKEAEEIIDETEKGSSTRDAGIISAAQKAEHYEIATYGTLRTLAGVLGYNEAVDLLEETLAEEKQCDVDLTVLAVSCINKTAGTEAE